MVKEDVDLDSSSEAESIEKERRQHSKTQKFNSYDYDQYQVNSGRKSIKFV